MMHGWGFGGGGGAGFGAARRFEEQYHCYSVAAADKAHLEKGDKILLPPSAFDTLARLQVDYPMLFQLTYGERTTHSGVLEFTAEEGCCYIPYWMMQNLLLEEGSLLTVKNVSLPKATFVKLQPQSVDFLEISNPRAVLEHALRNFSCVTKGDVIQIPYNGKNFHFALQQVKPADAACIIETDCNVDFDAPVGYQEPERNVPSPTTTMSTTGSLATNENDGDDKEDAKPPGVRIVNGQIVRPEQSQDATGGGSQTSDMVAEKVGQTGVQQNAAIPVLAPDAGYWAVDAGDGARLDGKAAAPLQDASGQELDVRKLRAEAAARRAEEAAKQNRLAQATGGQSLDGKPANGGNGEAQKPPVPAQPVSKRKKRVGSKFSRLKTNSLAFQGDANKM